MTPVSRRGVRESHSSEGKRYPTIYDVADLAGVSIGTVSKALNKPAQVSDATRRRVLDAVEAIDFVPKAAATSHARRGTGRIGVFAPFSSFSSFGERLNGVLATMADKGVEVAVFDVESAAESAGTLESLPATRSLDGLIVMSVPFGDKVAEAMRRGGLPVVLVEIIGHGFPSVTTDDEAGGRLAAATLWEAGCRRPAFIGHRQVQSGLASPSRRRLHGFEAELVERGGPLDPRLRILEPNDFDRVRQDMEEILRSDLPPDGIFAHTDELAAAAQVAARKSGLRVPEDIAIVGFDDSLIAQTSDLTTIRQPLHGSGEWAASTLLAMIANPNDVAPSLTMPVSLVRRGSA